MGNLSCAESMKMLDKVPELCKKINEWAKGINELKNKSDFTKSHYTKLFGTTGILNKSVMEALGFSDIDSSKGEKNVDICTQHLEAMRKQGPGLTAAAALGMIGKKIQTMAESEQQEYLRKLYADFEAFEVADKNTRAGLDNIDTAAFSQWTWLSCYEKAWMPFLVSLTACVGAMNSLSRRT